MLQRSLFSLLLVTLLVSAAAAMDHEPTGFGKARFGMSPEEVEKLYPGKVRVLGQENLGASPVFSPRVVRQVLPDQKILDLKEPTNVEFRYWDNKLWVVVVYFGQNTVQQVNEALRKEYGKPPAVSADSLWTGTKAVVNTANRDRWYAISDLAISKEAQAAFMEDLRRAAERQRGQQPAPPAPPAEK